MCNLEKKPYLCSRKVTPEGDRRRQMKIEEDRRQ